MSTTSNGIALLVGNRHVLIDEEDAEKVLAYRWHLFDNGRGHVYAQASVRVDGKPRALRLHRLVLGLDFGDRRIVDHISGNTLDNRKANLRVVDQSVNNTNRKRKHGGPMKTGSGWVVRTKKGGVREYHGFFLHYEEALRVFNSVIGDSYAR